MKGPLKGITVLEFEGLAPTVFAGMILADFGADVTIINRKKNINPIGIDTKNTYLNRGKKSLAADFKDPFQVSVIRQMMEKTDVVIDCFRPGKLEHIGLGPNDIKNDRLIFARVSGFGQTGPLRDYVRSQKNKLQKLKDIDNGIDIFLKLGKNIQLNYFLYNQKAGHDINYLSYSGILGTFSKEGRNPEPPNNVLADFAGGGGFGVIGILLALYERERTGKGQVVDVSLTDCVGYMSSFLHNMKKLGVWNNPRGKNLLDGGAHYYQTYKCKDGTFLAVGCIENQFYRNFLKGLNVEHQDVLAKNQYDVDEYEHLTEEFQKIILTKTREEWMQIFEPLDCCVSPVLDMNEMQNNQKVQKFIFKESDKPHAFQYAPSPILSNYQNTGKLLKKNHFDQQFNFGIASNISAPPPSRGQHTLEVLKQYSISQEDITKFITPKQKL
ncbi:hypothetical protein ABPG72_022174 [Tetrahymena utriculariae]